MNRTEPRWRAGNDPQAPAGGCAIEGQVATIGLTEKVVFDAMQTGEVAGEK